MKKADYFQLSLLWLAGFLTAWLLALPQWRGPGLTWDEAYYYPTFVSVRGWTGLLVSSPGTALSAEGIAAGWAQIAELPPVVKWLGAASLTFGGDGWSDLAAMRLVSAAAFGAALVLLRLIALRLLPRRWAWLPVAIYALHPHVVGHAQIAATETVFAAVNLLVLWAALKLGESHRSRALLAVCLGLALATKVNGIVLVAIVAFWLLTRNLIAARRNRLPGTPEAMALGWLLLAPCVAFAIWPWMWSSPVDHLQGYGRFINTHGHQPIWFLGRKCNYGPDRVTFLYPLVMLHLATPVALLLLTWTGLATGLTRLVQRRRMSPGPYLTALLFLGPLVAASLPGTPKYDSIRLFFPILAPAALLAAIGLHWLSRGLRRQEPIRRAAFATLILAAPLQLPTIDYYNLPTRWASAGATVFPFEETWWGNALDRRALEGLNEKLPPGARVKTLALQPDALTIYRDWGLLRDDIVIDGPPPYDAHLMQNRRGFWGNSEWLIFSQREPLATWGKGAVGEPLIYLFDGRPPGM